MIAAALSMIAGEVHSQKRGDRVRVLAGSAMRTSPGGQMVGVLSRTYEAPVEMVQGSAVRLRLNGFVNAEDLRLESNGARGTIGGVGAKAGSGGIVRLGRGEGEPALATLQRGAVVFPGAKSGNYLAVNRTIWVDKSRLAKFTGPSATRATTSKSAAAPVPAAATAPEASAPPNVAQGTNPAEIAKSALGRGATQTLPPMETRGLTALRSGPNGAALFTLPQGTVVTPLGAEGGWTRIRVDGWVATTDLGETGVGGSGALSAADLRADPDGVKGRIVRWTVEALSYQVADDLRRELNGEPYLLARGPGNERSILYLAVPDSLAGAARALAPLTTITITARVRSGRSLPGGVPILDLLELVRR